MKKNSRQFVLTISVVFVIVVAYILIKLLSLPKTEHLHTLKAALPEYNELFTAEIQSKLQILATVETSSREPVSNYDYDSKYHIKVFKIDLVHAAGLDQMLIERREHTDRLSGFVNPMVHNSFFEMSYMTGKRGPVSKVNFRFDGDTIEKVGKTDSIACYYLKIGTFAVGYDKEAANDIWGSAADNGPIPVSVAFIRKQKFLYLILLNVDRGPQTMQHRALWDILKKY
jgi:hypothetical protein